MISDKRKSEFKPTVLYIKRHNKTGLLYFGKTTNVNSPHLYKGSGVEWLHHLKSNGNDVSTIWVSEIYTLEKIDDLREFSCFFSEFFDIVGDSRFANKIIEDGLGGRGIPGRKASDETKKNMSTAQKLFAKNNPDLKTRVIAQNRENFAGHTEETKDKISKSQKGKHISEEQKRIISERKAGKSCYRNVITGDIVYLMIDDPLLSSGDYTGLTKGFFTYYDISGNKYWLQRTDEKINELGLKGATSFLGKKYKLNKGN